MKQCKMVLVGMSVFLFGAVQLFGAVAGCNNGWLLGNYNAEVTNLNMQATLQALNTNGGTVTPATGGSTSNAGLTGFSNNPRSLSGSVQGASRFYFDGNGTIVGSGVPAGGTVAITMPAGTYNVNTDCTATLTLTGGATFDAVVADSGKQVLFVETDSANGGAVGTLQRSSSCVNLNYSQSFAYSFSGATPMPATSTTGATGGAAASAAAFGNYGQVGTISIDGAGSFSFTQTMILNNVVTRSRGGGTYTVGQDCSLKLNFASSAPGTTSNFQAPVLLSGLTTDSNGGVLVLQPNSATSPVTGAFIVQ